MMTKGQNNSWHVMKETRRKQINANGVTTQLTKLLGVLFSITILCNAIHLTLYKLKPKSSQANI